MPTTRSGSQAKEKRNVPTPSPSTNLANNNSQSPQLGESNLLSRHQSMLAEEAPEGLPILDQLLKRLKPDSKEWVDEEKGLVRSSFRVFQRPKSAPMRLRAVIRQKGNHGGSQSFGRRGSSC
ncbi:hypothetical protein Y032_0187g1114 [Ancylostoma ceylanicum]|uniref:Uncharacterized protein n=1 Tax=Ancylostoma ceylanicum TaxID=53326 RepID=A0A016SR25_9BILA|nr:hypothetical protein Y032_0187g1114 [Ancylostoma ceylanicum]